MTFVHSFLPCRRIRTYSSFVTECCCSTLQWRQTTEDHCTAHSFQLYNCYLFELWRLKTVVRQEHEHCRFEKSLPRDGRRAPERGGGESRGWKRRKMDGIKWKLWFCKGCKVPMPIDGIYLLRIYLSLLLTPSMVNRFLKLRNNFNLTESIEKQRVKVYDPNLVSID